MTSSSGWASLIARVASCTIPSSSQAPEPSASLAAGSAEQEHGGDAERRGLAGLVDRVGDRQAVDPGHRRDGLATVDPVRDEHRVDEVSRVQPCLAHEPPQLAGAAQAAQTGLGKGHRLIEGIGADSPVTGDRRGRAFAS